MFLIGQTA